MISDGLKPTSLSHKERLESYQKSGNLQLNVCFSWHDSSKFKYVQHMLEPDLDKIVDILNRNGVLYICGDRSLMSKEVRKMLSDKIGAEEFKKLETQKQIREDLWT